MCGTDVNFATLVYVFSPGLDLFETTKSVDFSYCGSPAYWIKSQD